MPRSTAPVLFGRRMKRATRIIERWELRRGVVLFAVERNGSMWDAEIWIEYDLVLCGMMRPTQAKALDALETMRNRLVKSLTPEGR